MKATRYPKYGISLNKIEAGLEIPGSYEITVTQTVIDNWQGFVPSVSLIESSAPFAASTGLGVLPLPYSFVLNLTLGLGTECFTENALELQEIQQAQYLYPLQPGDTVSCRIMVDDVNHTDEEKSTIITSWHYLFNQNEQPVFRMKCMNLFPKVKLINNSEKYELDDEINLIREAMLNSSEEMIVDNQMPDIQRDEIILHPTVRQIQNSENLFWNTYFKNNSSIFSNPLSTKTKNKVSKGLITAITTGLATRDLREPLVTEIDRALYINDVSEGDCIKAFTYVKEIPLIQSDMEELMLRTIGVINTDTSVELKDTDFPKELFEEEIKASDIEKICKEQIKELDGKIAVVCDWRIVRKLHIS